MTRTDIKTNNYDLLRNKLDKTNDLVTACDKMRKYKNSINEICEAIINMPEGSAISKISINLEIKLPVEKDDENKKNPSNILDSLGEANSPEDFLKRLGMVDTHIKKNDKIHLSNYNLDLKSLDDKSLISILMRTRDVVDKGLSECIEKFNKLFE